MVNWTGQAVLIPVARIKELLSGGWPEFERPGVYLVRGESEDGYSRLYIGESENVAKRVQGHPAGLGGHRTLNIERPTLNIEVKRGGDLAVVDRLSLVIEWAGLISRVQFG